MRDDAAKQLVKSQSWNPIGRITELLTTKTRDLKLGAARTYSAALGQEQTQEAPAEGSDAQPTTDRRTAPAANRSRKRGPKPDYETAKRVAEIVARIAPDGDWRSKLDELFEAFDEEKIPIPNTWRKQRRECWADCLDRELAVKAIEYRLKAARQLTRIR